MRHTAETAEAAEQRRKECNKISGTILGAAIKVHQTLGPGLLESTYEACLAYELTARDMRLERKKRLPVVYDGIRIECGYRIDLLVESLVIVELKSVEKLLPIHDAQLLSYLKLARVHLGRLINFNVRLLPQGIRRLVDGF
jgi:GxxExxY protein